MYYVRTFYRNYLPDDLLLDVLLVLLELVFDEEELLPEAVDVLVELLSEVELTRSVVEVRVLVERPVVVLLPPSVFVFVGRVAGLVVVP